MPEQWIEGNQNVQIQNVTGSTIHVTFGGPSRRVPLEPAVIPLGSNVRSPARLVRARSGVVPYTARTGLLEELQRWLGVRDAFAVCLVGGRGGSGKTRLAVELCEQARATGWLSGMLTTSADPAALEALVAAPTARLVVVDYAETRAEQLEAVLPLLASTAGTDHPIRVMLLVRAAPRRSSDWTGLLRHRADALDAVLDDVRPWIIEELPLDRAERMRLFSAASLALAARAASPVGRPDPPDALSGAVFASPLMVVIAAYLAVHGTTELPTSRSELLDEMLHHEHRYWNASAVAQGLDTDAVLRRRVVALATLAGASSEPEAVGLLGLVPDLSDTSWMQRARLARWVNELYPAGPGWWNPLEPDLIGEHLVVETYSEMPAVLSGVLTRDTPQAVVRPLDLYARAAADHPAFAQALSPILGNELQRLSELAVNQAAAETDLDLLLGETTLAAALNRAVAVIAVEPEALSAALEPLPGGTNLTLGPLELTLQSQLARHRRQLAQADPAGYEPHLARSLTNLSLRLGDSGRAEEGLAASEEAVRIYRGLAAADPTDAFSLAGALNNFSWRLGDADRREESLAAIEEAIGLLRPLAAHDRATHECHLAGTLHNLAWRLDDVGRREEALAAIEEAIGLRRRLADANPADHEVELAQSSIMLASLLAAIERREDALSAIEEAAGILRRLAATNPAAHQRDLAMALTNLGSRLSEIGRREDALMAHREAVDTCRQLAMANPESHEPGLATALNNIAGQLRDVGRGEDAVMARSEAVAILRRVAAASPAAHESSLASALVGLRRDLEDVGRRPEAVAADEEAVSVFRRLAARRPAPYEPNLAGELVVLSTRLEGLGRIDASVAACEEAIDIYRRLALAQPMSHLEPLRMALYQLSKLTGQDYSLLAAQVYPPATGHDDASPAPAPPPIVRPQPHPSADPQGAAALNRRYVEDLARWEALPWLKRRLVPPPQRPKGI